MHAFGIGPNISISFSKKKKGLTTYLKLLMLAGSIILLASFVFKYKKKVYGRIKKLSPSINNFLLSAHRKNIIWRKFSNSPFGPTSTYFNVRFCPQGLFCGRKEDHFSAMVNLSLQASIYRLPPTSILKLCKQGFVTSKVKWKKREMPLKH